VIFLTEPEAKTLGVERRRRGPLALPRAIKRRAASAGEELFVVQMRCSNIPEPVREHKFHDTRRFRFDFAWPERKVALEIDGGVFSQGRHNRGKGYENDCIKFAEAAKLGWRVYRFSTGQVRSGEAISYISSEFQFEEI